MGLLSVIRSFGLIALLSRVGAAPAKQESKAFLKQVGNTTWVIGNGIWNMTQGRQYGTKLWYKGKDRVGTGVGHYVSYSG
jgi:rhamnogalacturonan endolyase